MRPVVWVDQHGKRPGRQFYSGADQPRVANVWRRNDAHRAPFSAPWFSMSFSECAQRSCVCHGEIRRFPVEFDEGGGLKTVASAEKKCEARAGSQRLSWHAQGPAHSMRERGGRVANENRTPWICAPAAPAHASTAREYVPDCPFAATGRSFWAVTHPPLARPSVPRHRSAGP